MMNRLDKKTRKKTRGFTLIELLVVVSVLAAIAGMTSVALDGYQQDAEEKLTRVEMQRIANAIRRFKEDTGYWPKKESAALEYKSSDAANFSFLFNMPSGMNKWDIEYAIGWHGPYIDLAAIKPMIIDDGNAGCPITNSADYDALQILAIDRVNTLVDKFQQIRSKTPGERYCLLAREKSDSTMFKIAEFSSSPYLYDINFSHTDSRLCDSDTSTSCIVLRSFGADGIDNRGSDASDDIVFILEVNED